MKSLEKATTAALAVLAIVPVFLISKKYVHFLPAAWWQSDALAPAIVVAVVVPVVWIVRRLSKPDGPITSPSGLPDNALIFRIIPALAFSGLIFVSVYVTLPGALALAFGRPTNQQVTATMNVVGSVDSPQRGCRYRSVIEDRLWGIYQSICFDSARDKQVARDLGPLVTVDLHGWGNKFGIYYTATDPVSPADQ